MNNQWKKNKISFTLINKNGEHSGSNHGNEKVFGENFTNGSGSYQSYCKDRGKLVIRQPLWLISPSITSSQHLCIFLQYNFLHNLIILDKKFTTSLNFGWILW